MNHSLVDYTIGPLRQEDALYLNKFFVSNTEKFRKYLPETLAENRTLEDTRSYVHKMLEAMEAKSEFVFTIRHSYNNNIAGLVILTNFDLEKKQGEFSYCLGKNYEGKGWMTAAIKAASEYAKDDLGLETLQIVTDKNNASSIRVAESSGFIWKETLFDEYESDDDTLMEMELYELSINSFIKSNQ